MNKTLMKLLVAILLAGALSGCLANPPDTSTGKTQAASLIFTDFEQIAQLVLADRNLLISIIEETYLPDEVQAHDYYWLFTEQAIRIEQDEENELFNSWFVIHQRTNDTLRFRQTMTQAWVVDFKDTHINNSLYFGQFELLTDTLELPLGDPKFNQSIHALGQAFSRDPENNHYDITYSFKTIETLHAARTEHGYEFLVGELEFEVNFPNRPQPTDRFVTTLFMEGESPSKEYIWK